MAAGKRRVRNEPNGRRCLPPLFISRVDSSAIYAISSVCEVLVVLRRHSSELITCWEGNKPPLFKLEGTTYVLSPPPILVLIVKDVVSSDVQQSFS